METNRPPRKNHASGIPGISEILNGVAAYYGWEEKLEEEQAKALLGSLVGETMAGHIRRVSFSKGVLYVHIENSAARNELMYRTSCIREEINRRLGRETVLSIRITA